jgi:phage baseplate assembly protein gpV
MSYTERLTNLIYRCIDHAMSRYSHPRVGTVTSYDPKTHSVKLARQPEGIETGFIPLGSHAIGNNWGIVSGAQIGDQFMMGFINGDVEVPFIMSRLFSDQETPPSVNSGELIIKHSSGSSIKLAQDGSVAHTSNTGLSFTTGSPTAFTGGGNLN